MTYFFDEAQRVTSTALSEDRIEDAVREESRVVAIIKRVIALPGFPQDIAQRIEKVLTWDLNSEKGKRYGDAMKYSVLIEEMHESFHLLAAKRGPWSDKPDDILWRMESKDNEEERE